MLTFLRRIRRSLLESGRVKSYLLYAIGEIALVVIGILIALQINNWNEGRINDQIVRSHLLSLVEALEHDIREHSISMEFNEFMFHSWQYLLQHAGIEPELLRDMPRPDRFIVAVWKTPYPENINKKFVDASMEQFNRAFTNMVFNYSAINEMNNLGIMSDIKNQALKKKINEYYYYLDWRFGEESTNRRIRLSHDLRDYFREKHSISCSYPPDPSRILEVIGKDEQVVIMMKDLIKVANSHYWDTRSLRQLGIDLVALIHDET
ncbi:MAG: DUF6090 family protein [Saprospiraceae bacterium]|nr:DUF6090 family protein [Saprospiraceae bacterium]